VFSIGKQGQSILMTDIVEALSTQGNVNILSKPRIATLNNQPAIIKVAREDVYFQTSRTTTFGETTTETNVNFLTVGIVLSVTPQISGDGIITMTIHPSITEKTGERTSIIGDSVPIIDVRETETVARVRNNQTVLIGGLLQDKVTENTLGLPILKDIPYLGKLFTHINRETTKTELVIMLTPRIVNDEAMQSITAQEINKFDRLYKRSN
jgi:type II secretory pathway component GspD/PulD (secretin)